MPIVYKITNKTTGRFYIGQTQRTLEARWRAHCSSANQGSPFRFHSAIRKYGPDDWRREIVFEHDDISAIRAKEEQLINEERACVKGIGYNAKPGGCGGWIVPAHKYDEWKSKAGHPGHRNPKFSGHTDREIVELVVKELESGAPSIRQALLRSKEKNNTPIRFSDYRFAEYPGNQGERLREAIIDAFPEIEHRLKYKRTKEHTAKLLPSLERGRKARWG